MKKIIKYSALLCCFLLPVNFYAMLTRGARAGQQASKGKVPKFGAATTQKGEKLIIEPTKAPTGLIVEPITINAPTSSTKLPGEAPKKPGISVEPSKQKKPLIGSQFITVEEHKDITFPLLNNIIHALDSETAVILPDAFTADIIAAQKKGYQTCFFTKKLIDDLSGLFKDSFGDYLSSLKKKPAMKDLIGKPIKIRGGAMVMLQQPPNSPTDPIVFSETEADKIKVLEQLNIPQEVKIEFKQGKKEFNELVNPTPAKETPAIAKTKAMEPAAQKKTAAEELLEAETMGKLKEKKKIPEGAPVATQKKPSTEIIYKKQQKAEPEITVPGEQARLETQTKTIELAEQIKEAQRIVEQEIELKNRLAKEAQLKAEVDVDFENFLDTERLEQEIKDTESVLQQLQAEIDAQEARAQQNQKEQSKIAKQIAKSEDKLRNITEEITALQKARENMQMVKQQEFDAANKKYELEYKSQQKEIAQQLEKAKTEIQTTEAFNKANNTQKQELLQLLEQNAQKEAKREADLIAQQKEKTLKTIANTMTTEQTRLENEVKELKRQQKKQTKYQQAKLKAQQAMKDAQQEIADTQQELQTAQESAAQANLIAEQAKQQRIAMENRQKAQKVLRHGEKQPAISPEGEGAKPGISIQPIIPKIAVTKELSEEKPLIGVSKIKPEIVQKIQAVPTATIPEITPTMPIEKPTSEKLIPLPTEEKKERSIDAKKPQEKPTSLMPSTETLAQPSYDYEFPQLPTQKYTRSSGTQATQPSLSSTTSAEIQQPQSQGLVVPSFGPQSGQQLRRPTGPRQQPSTTKALPNQPTSTPSSTQYPTQPEFSWPEDFSRSFDSGKPYNGSAEYPSYTHPGLPSDLSPEALAKEEDLKKKEALAEERPAAIAEVVRKKLVKEKPPAIPQKTTPELSEKYVHWFWRLIAFIINFIKKLLRLS